MVLGKKGGVNVGDKLRGWRRYYVIVDGKRTYISLAQKDVLEFLDSGRKTWAEVYMFLAQLGVTSSRRKRSILGLIRRGLVNEQDEKFLEITDYGRKVLHRINELYKKL